MTHDEFWTKVRAAGPWRVDEIGQVRNQDCCCPLGAVCRTIDPNNQILPLPNYAVRVLAMPDEVGWRIVDAADHSGDLRRPLLLRELGLT